MKRCSRCKETLPLEDFGLHRGNPDGHQYYCRTCRNTLSRADYAADPETRNRRAREWRRANPDAQRLSTLRSAVRKLERGEQIANMRRHHWAMAELKALRGDPRPDGATLSLIAPDSPDAYFGYESRRGGRRPYRLSINPDDYTWESMAANRARGYHTAGPKMEGVTI